jgi:hypothetical protein
MVPITLYLRHCQPPVSAHCRNVRPKLRSKKRIHKAGPGSAAQVAMMRKEKSWCDVEDRDVRKEGRHQPVRANQSYF